MNEKQFLTYVQQLVYKVIGMESVWLFGSRANNSFRSNSDWDLMVFANKEAFEELKTRTHLKNENIDVIVAINMQTFSEPWSENTSNCKEGNVSTWEWKINTPDSANYTSIKNSSAWYKNDQPDFKKLVAKRIWS